MKTEAAYWLALLDASGLKRSTLKPIVQQWYLLEGKPIVELFNLSIAELRDGFRLTEAQARGILKAAETYPRQLQTLEKWQAQGIEVLPLSHPHYPSRFIYALPPKLQPLMLWASGPTDLLAEPAVTVLGSDDPSPETTTFIRQLVTTLVEEEIGVVSGYGKGLDRLAFETTLAAPEGRAVAILPMGLSAFARLTRRLDAPVQEGRAVLLSPFAPDTPFDEALAEARNLLVDSLAMALLVPAADAATHDRARAALERGIPVLVGLTDSPENRALIEAGAFLMTDIGEVVEMVQQAVIDSAMQAQQAQTPAAEAPPPAPPLLDETDDYALGKETVEPLPAGEALDILATMGDVPDSLRARLMALEAENRQRKTEGDGSPPAGET